MVFSWQIHAKTDSVSCQFLCSPALLSYQNPQPSVQSPVSCFQENNLKALTSAILLFSEKKVPSTHLDTKMWGKVFLCMAQTEEKQRVRKGRTYWGNTRQVRADFVEMGALMSNFKVNSTFRRKRKVILVGRKRDDE